MLVRENPFDGTLDPVNNGKKRDFSQKLQKEQLLCKPDDLQTFYTFAKCVRVYESDLLQSLSGYRPV